MVESAGSTLTLQTTPSPCCHLRTRISSSCAVQQVSVHASIPSYPGTPTLLTCRAHAWCVCACVCHCLLPGDGPFGRRVAAMTTGEVATVAAETLHLVDGFAPGDYFCGTNGSIEVVGDVAGSPRGFVRERGAGTQFLIPASRVNPQLVYVHAPSNSAQVSLFRDSRQATATEVMYLGPGSTQTFFAAAASEVLRVASTADILISYVAGVSGSAVTGIPRVAGTVDYVAVPAADGGAVYGSPFIRAFFAATIRAPYRLQCYNGTRFSTSTGFVGVVAGTYSAIPSINTTAPAATGCVVNSLSGTVPIAAQTVRGSAPPLTAAMWTPAALLARHFVLPFAPQDITLVCSSVGNATLQQRRGATAGQAVVDIDGADGVATASITDARFRRPGTWMETSVPCTVFVTTPATGAIVTLWGAQAE
eukprot:m.983651 g.983651  ORF g.983651 m.983651 type:complete len:420 (-) comp23974_c0_seq5:3279-4538(-)